MDAGRTTRKRARSAEPDQVPATAPLAVNDFPPQLTPFVDALAELLVLAYRRETIEQGTGDSPERPKAKTKDLQAS